MTIVYIGTISPRLTGRTITDIIIDIEVDDRSTTGGFPVNIFDATTPNIITILKEEAMDLRDLCLKRDEPVKGRHRNRPVQHQPNNPRKSK